MTCTWPLCWEDIASSLRLRHTLDTPELLLTRQNFTRVLDSYSQKFTSSRRMPHAILVVHGAPVACMGWAVQVLCRLLLSFIHS